MNIYQKDYTKTPLIFELIKNHQNREAIDYLEQHPKDINLKGWMDHTPLHKAAECGNLELAVYLVNNDAEVNAERSGVYATPLCWAKTIDIAMLLLNAGATMNDRELDMATRDNRVDIIDELLSRGAKINRIEPQFLNCSTIAALKVYLKHGVDITLSDKNGSTILHRKAWTQNLEVFDYAYKSGVQWSKDSSKRNPYILAKQGGRNKFLAFIENNYPVLIEHRLVPIDLSVCRKQIIHVESSDLDKSNIIGLTDCGHLIKFHIQEGVLKVVKSVFIDLPRLRNFTINNKHQIVLPTGDKELLIIDQNDLSLVRKVIVDNRGFDQISYCSLRKVFLASSNTWSLTILDLEYREVRHIKLNNGTFKPIINNRQDLILMHSYDQESFFELYKFGLDDKVDHINTFFKDWKNYSIAACFTEEDFLIVFPKVIELYSMKGNELKLIYEYELEHKAKDFIKYRIVSVGKGRVALGFANQIHVFQVTDRIELLRAYNVSIENEILLLHYVDLHECLVVCTINEITLIDLSSKKGSKKWYNFFD